MHHSSANARLLLSAFHCDAIASASGRIVLLRDEAVAALFEPVEDDDEARMRDEISIGTLLYRHVIAVWTRLLENVAQEWMAVGVEILFGSQFHSRLRSYDATSQK